MELIKNLFIIGLIIVAALFVFRLVVVLAFFVFGGIGIALSKLKKSDKNNE